MNAPHRTKLLAIHSDFEDVRDRLERLAEDKAGNLAADELDAIAELVDQIDEAANMFGAAIYA